MSTLSLNDIVKINVNLSPRSAVRKGFNLGLIVGTSNVIKPEERVKLYNTPDGMIEDGFTEDMPEYKAALLYFSQQKRPDMVLVGRHVVSLTELVIGTTLNPDTGEYIVNIEPPASDTGSKFFYTASSSIISAPEYNTELDLAWIPATDGEELAVTAGAYIMVVEAEGITKKVKRAGLCIIGGGQIPLNLSDTQPESVTDAIRACRSRNTDWYLMTYCGATSDEIFSIAQYIETATPSCVQFFTTDEAISLDGSPNSIFAKLEAMNYTRSLGQYSAADNAVCGIMGYAMGANVKTSSSAYTLMHKRVTGVKPDSLNDTQVSFLQKANGNYYVSRGSDGEYSMFEQGTMANGTWFDEVLNLDMLVNDMQLSILDLLVSRPKIPQTEAGMSDIKLAILPSLRKMRQIGFIAPGKWNGPSIWTTADYAPLQTGDMLEDGYMVFSEPVDLQSQTDRDARIAPPIYTPIKLAGAIHTVVVQIDVNR